MYYDYKMLTKDLERLSRSYPEMQLFSIGNSVEGRQINCVRFGGGEKKLFLNGAHHGLESLTSALLVKFLDEYIRAALCEERFFCSDAHALSQKVQLYVVPMVNPDGVEMAVYGADFVNPFHRDVIRRSGIFDFTGIWQANVHGVDLNHNYDAAWQSIKSAASPSLWGGPHPESEPETRAVTALVRRCGFDMLIAFHSQGREIYYDFDNCTPTFSLEFARELARVSGYTVSVPTGTASFGGCKDWFIKEFDKPGFTVEIGEGQNPLPLERLEAVYTENARLILRAAELCLCDVGDGAVSKRL